MRTSGFLTGVGLVLALAVSGCGPSRADMKRMQDRLAKLQSSLESERQAHARTSKKLRQRIARLESELAVVRKRLAVSVRPGPRPPRRPSSALGRLRSPLPRASCPADLPDGARKLKRRMRAAKARKLLRGVKLRVYKKIAITGKGTRTRAVWSGPCFRVTVAKGRLLRVELQGVEPRRRSRRRRRRRR